MCTMIARAMPVQGRLKSDGRWGDVERMSVAYDHPVELDEEHALLLDMVDTGADRPRRVALELTFDDARRLHALLTDVLAEAERV